jgi:2-aminoadipate transaminase
MPSGMLGFPVLDAMKHSAFSTLGRRTAEPPISWLMKTTLDHPHLISLAAGFTDNPSLPVREAAEVLAGLLRSPRTGQPALQYGTTVGDPTLRALTAERLRALDHLDPARGARACPADRMVITNGSQQLLYMLTEALCDPGDIVLIEDPTYFVYLGIAQSHGLHCRGIRLADDGVDLDHLAEVLEQLRQSGDLRRVKLLYLVSYYQNPTGRTTSFEKKVRALELLRRHERAAGHPIYLLEDAAYRELRFAGPAVKSALATDRAEARVIYAGTYSKPFATGARVGFGILPKELFAAVTRIKGNHDFGSANLLQQLMARALKSGRYESHLSEVACRYAQKAAVMGRALRQHFPASVGWEPPLGGMYVWARLPQHVSAGPKSRFFRAALARDVLYVPGELCYAHDPCRVKPPNEMRLSFGGASLPSIREGIARLGEVVSSFCRAQRRATRLSPGGNKTPRK